MDKLEPIPPAAMQPLIATLESFAFTKGATSKQFRHHFQARHFGSGKHDSSCVVTVFRHGDQALVVLQDIGHGTSVTNASEQIATEVLKLEALDFDKTAWLECYPYHGGDWDFDGIAYDLVLTPGGVELRHPQWKRMKNDIIRDFLRNFLTPTKHEYV